MAQLDVFQKEPGIYITEAASPPPPASGVAPGIGAMFGVAEWGPVGVATLVQSFGEFETIFGGYISTTYPSYKQVKKFFQNGGQNLYFVRIVHYTTISNPITKASVAAVATLTDNSSVARFIIRGKYDGALGNSLCVNVEAGSGGVTNEYKVTVKFAGVIAEAPYDNVSLDVESSNYMVNRINMYSNWISIAEGTGIGPISIAISSVATLTAGTNGLTGLVTTDYIGDASAQTGIKAFNIIDDPILVACPDADMTTDVLVRKEIGRWCDNDRVFNFGILCVPEAHNAQAAISFVSATLALDSPRTALYYPWVKDADDGDYISPVGAVMGVYARFASDINRGVWWSPAGTGAFMYGIAGVESKASSTQAGMLNEKRINVIKNLPDIGVVIWGSRTLAIAKVADFRYIGVRLNTSNLEYLIQKNTLWAVHRPNDMLLWDQVRLMVKSILVRRWRDGGLDGATPAEAFKVICDSTVNTPAQKQAGIVVCQIGIRNKQTAEFVWFNVAQLASGAQVEEG